MLMYKDCAAKKLLLHVSGKKVFHAEPMPYSKVALKRRGYINIVFCITLIAFSLFVFSACAGQDDSPQPSNAAGTTAAPPDTAPGNGLDNDPDTTLQENAPPLVAFPPFQIPVSVASGISVEENESAIIDYSNASEGYVMAKFLRETDRSTRVIVETPTGNMYVYTLAVGEFEVFPLTEGDGTYIIGVFEQVEDQRYRTILKVHVDVALSDPLLPFLRPSQFVNFNQDSVVVRTANEVVVGAASLLDKVSMVFNFIIENIEYDFDLANAVQDGQVVSYIPVLDEVLARGVGICFDYAAVMTAMLRSQGIPTQMVHGYTGEAFHAWINVYSEEEGWINNIIFFDGENWILMDPTFAAAGGAEGMAQFIGEGADYFAKFYF